MNIYPFCKIIAPFIEKNSEQDVIKYKIHASCLTFTCNLKLKKKIHLYVETTRLRIRSNVINTEIY